MLQDGAGTESVVDDPANPTAFRVGMRIEHWQVTRRCLTCHSRRKQLDVKQLLLKPNVITHLIKKAALSAPGSPDL